MTNPRRNSQPSPISRKATGTSSIRSRRLFGIDFPEREEGTRVEAGRESPAEAGDRDNNESQDRDPAKQGSPVWSAVAPRFDVGRGVGWETLDGLPELGRALVTIGGFRLQRAGHDFQDAAGDHEVGGDSLP